MATVNINLVDSETEQDLRNKLAKAYLRIAQLELELEKSEKDYSYLRDEYNHAIWVASQYGIGI